MALAASYLGATLVPLNTWYKQTELAWTLRHCGLKLLVSATRFLKADYLALLHTIVPEARGAAPGTVDAPDFPDLKSLFRSEEHTSELQSLMRNSYAVFCLKKKKTELKVTTTH